MQALSTSGHFRTEKMTASEAFVETLVGQGVQNVFGIVGSAFMVSTSHICFTSFGMRML